MLIYYAHVYQRYIYIANEANNFIEIFNKLSFQHLFNQVKLTKILRSRLLNQ